MYFIIINLLTALVYDHYRMVQNECNFRGALTIVAQLVDIYENWVMKRSVREMDPSTGMPKTISYDKISEILEAKIELEDTMAEARAEEERLGITYVGYFTIE